MPDQVLVHDPLIEKIQESIDFRFPQAEQFDPWFEANGQKLIGVQQEWIYGRAGLKLMECVLPFTTSLTAHDLHDAYRAWLTAPNDVTRTEVKHQGRRVYRAQHYNKKAGSWQAHRALSYLSNIPTLRRYAVDGLMNATYCLSSIHTGAHLNEISQAELRNAVPNKETYELEGFLSEEFSKIESENIRLRIYPYLLVMQQFEQI